MLALFPGVASRLVRAADGGYGLEPTTEGCTFEVASAQARFADADPHALVDPVETVEGRPLARVRLTHTPDGSVLGVAVSHAVADGFSYFFFLSAWSRVYHGREVVPPFLDRCILPPGSAAAAPAEASGRGPSEPLGTTGLFLGERRTAIPRDRMRWTRRLFPRAEPATPWPGWTRRGRASRSASSTACGASRRSTLSRGCTSSTLAAGHRPLAPAGPGDRVQRRPAGGVRHPRPGRALRGGAAGGGRVDVRICLPLSTRDGPSTGGDCPPAQRAPVPPSSPA